MTMMRGITLLGLGAGLMYFLDPDRGRRRRARIRHQIDHTVHELDDTIQTTMKDLNNRFEGLVHEVKSQVTDQNQSVPDRVLEDRVRSRMGRVVSHPRAIEVSAVDGRVCLRGPVLAAEAETLFDAVASVPGVASLDNQLEMHTEPGNIPSLQGGRTRTGPMQRSWSPSTKFLVGSAAAGMLWSMAGRRSLIRPLIAMAGAGLVARGVMLNAEPGGWCPSGMLDAGPPPGAPDWTPGHDSSYPITPVI